MGKRFLCWGIFLMSVLNVSADEGMWSITQFSGNNLKKMRQLGLNRSAETFTRHTSKATVMFGDGCTASFISARGLLLTNYHCSYNAVAQNSTPQRNLVETGYWAVGRDRELPVKGLSVTLDREVKDVSAEVLALVGKNVKLHEAMTRITKQYTARMPQYKWVVKSYRENTLFLIFGREVFQDVRLVGVLPQQAAKFGGETDNYMWPRHNPDFAYFRVYADRNGRPAEYSEQNVPYCPKHYLQVSTEGYQQGDFALSVGYPARTDRLAVSAQIQRTVDVSNRPIIEMRGALLNQLTQVMRADPKLNLSYYETFSKLANEYKNYLGINEWIAKQNLIAKKQRGESELLKWANSRKEYAGIGAYPAALRNADSVYSRTLGYFNECFNHCSQMLNFADAFGLSMEAIRTGTVNGGMSRKDYLNNVRYYYSHIDPRTDRDNLLLGLNILKRNVPESLQPSFLRETVEREFHGNLERFVDDLYARTLFRDSVKIREWLDKPWCNYKDDPAVQVCQSIKEASQVIREKIAETQNRVDPKTASRYRKAMIEFKGDEYYPDADRTQRFSYGSIVPLENRNYQTLFSEIARKDDGKNPDYRRTERLRELWEGKDLGRWAVNGDIPVCFITNGDATGGNSGSPMLNKNLEMIGLVCDCNWESMTRDYTYSKELHRVICVDIRFILYLTEKYSGAGALVDEILNR